MSGMEAPIALSNEQKQRDRVRRHKRDRLAQLQVLLADRDTRAALLVHRLMFSLGFRRIDVATSGEEALALLSGNRYDLIITEWNMHPVDGMALVKAIRTARDAQSDIPILMLTAETEVEKVKAARDVGVTEFMVKPFTARSITDRIISIIDKPRAFVVGGDYRGPCRRRRELPPELMVERRVRMPEYRSMNTELQKQLGSVADILTDEVVAGAQAELQKAEVEFLDWARDDIRQLEENYLLLKANPSDLRAHRLMLDTAYSIKAQAGIFGYDLGTGISSMLTHYLTANPEIYGEKLTVVRKHIDAIVVIFSQQIKETGHVVGQELINSLRVLTKKLG